MNFDKAARALEGALKWGEPFKVSGRERRERAFLVAEPQAFRDTFLIRAYGLTVMGPESPTSAVDYAARLVFTTDGGFCMLLTGSLGTMAHAEDQLREMYRKFQMPHLPSRQKMEEIAQQSGYTLEVRVG